MPASTAAGCAPRRRLTHELHVQVTDCSLATLTGMSSLVSLQARGCPSFTPAAKLAAKHLLDVTLAH